MICVGEILREEFMLPNRISTYRLAKDINVSVSRIQEILVGKRKVTADTSIRLDRYFGVSDGYFLRLQAEVDIREAIKKYDEEKANDK